MPSLAIRIRRARRNAGLSQRALAALINVSHSTVGHWETGRSAPNTRILVELARITHTDLHCLVIGYPHPDKKPDPKVASA